MSPEIIAKAEEYVKRVFSGNAGGHDAEHTLRVHRNALLLAEQEKAEDTLTIALASLLHDVDDHKLFNTKNNANARAFLGENSVPDDLTDRICSIINSVSFSRNSVKVDLPVEAQIVQDADRLDAMGAIGIARTFAYGGEHGRPLSSTIDHFHEKLLLLRDLMNTESARRIAEERHSFMEAFLLEFSRESL